MIDSPTLKALLSTVLTFAFVIGVGALTSAIGQNATSHSTAPAANPYENVESEPAAAAHNSPAQAPPAPDAAHNTP